jgi:uncharacterized protein (TIRG00374 family)
MSRLARGIALSVAAGAGIYLLIAVASGDGAQVAQKLRAFPPSLLALGLGLASLNYLFRFAKWHYYLRLLQVNTWPLPPQPAPPRPGESEPRPHLDLYDSLLVFLAGFALTVTPGKVGEVLKSYLLKESHREPMARTAPIIFGERLTDLLSLLLLALLGISTWMSPSQRYLVGLGFAACAGLIVAVVSRPLVLWGLGRLERLPPRRLTAALVPKLRELYASTYLLVRPGPLLLCTGLSIAAWFCECLAFYLIVRGCPDGGQASLLLCTFIYAMMTVAGALVFVPGGLGVTEGGMVLLLAQLGAMSSSSAVAATLIIRIQTLWFAVLLGVLALVGYARRQRLQVTEVVGAVRARAGGEAPPS